MARIKRQFICNQCGSVHPKWLGKCPDCQQWNALEEVVVAPGDGHLSLGGMLDAGQTPAPMRLSELAQQTRDQPHEHRRLATGIGELDRVLGGAGDADQGLVPGSAILIGGDPGIGKSTLMLQVAGRLVSQKHTVLYVTSEESAHQLHLRARRLKIDLQDAQDLWVLADTCLERVMEQIRRTMPDVVVIDSVQMIYKPGLPAAPGSVSQLRACGLELAHLAKTQGCCVLLVGHVTKEGRLAGPRLLEHMVDTVLYFEGDRYHSYRIVRSIKNRFGTTLEVGLFEMTEQGLMEVSDGAGLLAAEYHPRSGSIVCPVLQGSRCLLVEIQALTATGFLGSAKRKSSGLDTSRLAMLIAVLEKRSGQRLADQDIFTSVVGGLKVAEPAADLAIAMAIAGAHMNRQPMVGQGGVCVIGEVGLGGEIRHVQQLPQRLNEAARLGFSHVIGPAPASTSKQPAMPVMGQGCQYLPVKHIEEAMAFLQ